MNESESAELTLGLSMVRSICAAWGDRGCGKRTGISTSFSTGYQRAIAHDRLQLTNHLMSLHSSQRSLIGM